MAVLREFKRLDAEYRENTTDSPAIEALNTLPPDERALAILYTTSGGNLSATADYLHCDRHTIDRYILAIRCKIEDALRCITHRIEQEEYRNYMTVTPADEQHPAPLG